MKTLKDLENGLELDNIYNCDCEKGIELLPDDSLDIVITSPPYNVDLGNNKKHKNPYDLYNDNKEHWDYIAWLKNIFAKIKPKMKSGGRVCINIGDGKNGRVPTHSDITQFMIENGYLYFTTIAWEKNQIGNRTSWGSWMSPSCPSFPTPFEFILIFAKDNIKLQHKGETDIERQEFMDWSLALWKMQPETKQKKIGHSAMFPKELPKRLLKMLAWKDAVVLDPFAGAGTTLVVAKELGRKYIGFEISENYCEITDKRLKEI